MNPVRNIEYPRRNKISNGVKISIINLQKKIPIRPQRIKETVLKTLSLEGLKKSGEITVYFVNDKKIQKLNRKFLKKNCATDVLSFDMSLNSEEIMADIVISTDTTIRNAKVFRTTPLYEAYLYVIHGLLHLFGHDDRTKKQKQLMHKRERVVIKKCLSIKQRR